MTIKLHEACDWDPAKVPFPCAISPKIDGVRAANLDRTLRGRSLKTHKNIFITDEFSGGEFYGFDGELIAASVVDPLLVSKTSSMASTRDLLPPVYGWCLFDYATPETEKLGYLERYELLKKRVMEVTAANPRLAAFLLIVPVVVVNNMEQLIQWEESWLDQGFEGLIGRALDKPYKHGRATANEGGLWRIKRFIETEARVVSIVEGEKNTNEATVNEKGNSSRSTHKENMIPNGSVGNMQCELCEDVWDPFSKTGEPLFKAGQIVTVSPGKMTEYEALHYFQNPDQLVNHIIKFKFFPKGVKDKPRFPTYICHRDERDIGSPK